jgi:glucose-1-phosphate cytidylyltransferase
MILINGIPIILRIMKFYAKHGFKNFYIALGYKGNVIKNFFKNNSYGWKIKLIDTGNKTMTGGRLKKLAKYLDNETFMMTYGDGLSNINLKKLLYFHKRNKKLVTITAVRPPARFGFLKIKGNMVNYFKEKSQLDEGWINGGFFVIEPKFLKYIKNYKTYLEREPLERLAKEKQLVAFKHKDFWQCMDTLRDRENLEKILKKNKYRKIFE